MRPRTDDSSGGVLTDTPYSPRFVRFFAKYVRRMMRKDFGALRLERESAGALEDLTTERRPLLLCLNHASWWDPLVAMTLGVRFLEARDHRAPMDAAQLERFGFMRRLGMFPIEPDDPESLSGMVGAVLEYFGAADRPDPVDHPAGRLP